MKRFEIRWDDHLLRYDADDGVMLSGWSVVVYGRAVVSFVSFPRAVWAFFKYRRIIKKFGQEDK